MSVIGSGLEVGSPGGADADRERELEALRREVAAWRERYRTGELRDVDFTGASSRPVAPLYTPLDAQDLDYGRDLGLPGRYPFTRGIHDTGYRGRLWTMRQFSGFGTAQETNARYKFLLGRGQTGLSVAFDFPTLMGYDSDHPRSLGEVGKCGVAISSLADMETLFGGIPLGEVSTSMTINGPAAMLFCFYVAAAERQGVPAERLRGTVQNDILKEYMAQHAWIYGVEAALKIIVDLFEWGSVHAPQWNTISISGYHIREAGATAAQELAFTLANGFTYVERGIARGLDVDAFAPRLSYFWDIHNDFFEEIAKLRAARRIWARHMRERYGATSPRSWTMRFHSQTAGVTLTAQQPMNNVVRVAYQALAAVVKAMVSRTSRREGRGGKTNSFWAWYSFKMSFCRVPPRRWRATPWSSALATNMARMTGADALIVIDVVIADRSMSANRSAMSSMVSMATPTRPTSPWARGWSLSRPICVGRSKATERPVWPAARRSW